MSSVKEEKLRKKMIVNLRCKGDRRLKVKVLVIALIIILGAGVWWGLKSAVATQNQGKQGANATGTNTPDSPNSSTGSSWSAPRLDNQGGVEVAVTWEKEGSDSSMLKFAVTMNNHMIDLSDFDYSRNTELKISGTTVPAVVKVLNNGGGGHHVTAELGVQSTDLSKLKSGSQFELGIKNLANVPMRNFTWAY
ncbi:hypothetical protein [Desulfosporosinus acidiphilus]|nr:hypothetical protein [Desulfosporosinus acidiphilus]